MSMQMHLLWPTRGRSETLTQNPFKSPCRPYQPNHSSMSATSFPATNISHILFEQDCYRSCYLNRIEQSHKKASCRRQSSLCTQQKKQYSCPAPTPATILATKNHRGKHDTTMRHLNLQEVHLGFLDMNSFPEPSRHLWPCKRCALHRFKLRLSYTSVQRRFGLAPFFFWGGGWLNESIQ